MKTMIPGLLTILFLITGTATAEIYKCIDGAGQVTFSAKPGPGCRLLPGSALADKRPDGKKWYEEKGTLHRSTVGEWKAASYENRLATSADWFVSITKEFNPVLHRELKRLKFDEYLGAMKNGAIQLEKCVSGRVSKMKYPNIKTATIAAFCYKALYGIK